ncbi:MAG: hypothetical protein IJV43_00360 [Oscillospiraceae bacterium]|nr:hypothetical protein [Oscillospiraceae bacterium]
MKLREFIMVVCRNAGRYYGVATRSAFYRDFLRSLYDNGDFPAFYDNKVACLTYYVKRLGYLPRTDFRDESKADHYVFYYEPAYDTLKSITIREIIMKMYDRENAFAFAKASLSYECSMFELLHMAIVQSEIVSLALELNGMDLSKYTGEEPIDAIGDQKLEAIIDRARRCKEMVGMDKPQDRIEKKRAKRQITVHQRASANASEKRTDNL